MNWRGQDADYDEIRLGVERALASEGGTGDAQLNGATEDRQGEAGRGYAMGEDASDSAGKPVAHAPSVASTMERSDFRGATTSSTR